jgi:hypothetical protein
MPKAVTQRSGGVHGGPVHPSVQVLAGSLDVAYVEHS